MPNTSKDQKPIPAPSRSSLWRVAAAYGGIFALFFWGIHGGVGQYWDWSFPYFSDQMGNFFSNNAASWTEGKLGTPLGYSSDYFLRLFVSFFSFIPPEWTHYLLLVVIFALGSFGMYLLARRHTRSSVAFIIGLAAFVNPAIFYKYTAGHFNYFVSYTLFIYLLNFLFYKFQRNARSAIVVGLFLAFIGFQIQFFVITGMFLVVFFALNRKLFGLRYALLMILIPLLINAVWLSNFAVGAASVAGTGAAAAKVSFASLSSSSFLSIFTFSFSKATLLSQFYAFYELLWNAALFIFLLWLLVREKQRHTKDAILLIFMVLMIFMATGLFQMINLGPLTALYPMLREVGHFAPVIVLPALLLVSRLVRASAWRWGLVGILAGSLLIVGVKFQYFSQHYSYSAVRSQFAPFKQVADADTSTYRVLSYPFFDQYSFNAFPKDPAGDFPLKNTGHDSFAGYASQPFVDNAVAPYQFQDSLQNRLLQTYDVDVLRPYNIKYIFDFSTIYTSNYEKYVPPTTYNDDLSLIKNDPHFLDKLAANNPGKVQRISPHVLEITDVAPRVGSTTNVYDIGTTGDADSLSNFSEQALGKPLDYVMGDHQLEGYTGGLTSLFADPSRMQPNWQAGTFDQTIKAPAGSQAQLYINHAHDTIYYQATTNLLTLYTQSAGQLTVNGQTVYNPGTRRHILAQLPLGKGRGPYYALFKGNSVTMAAGTSGRIGVGTTGDVVTVYQGQSTSVVTNGSFEQGLWQKSVNDCNDYDFDNSAKLGMQLSSTASDGKQSLELSATHHDACTYNTMHVDPGNTYVLSFDYQSPDAHTASFYLGDATMDHMYAKGSQTVTGTGWNHYSTLVQVPRDATSQADLYLYALEQTGQTTINRYDNVSLVKLSPVQNITVPAVANQYEKVALASGTNQFHMVSSGQSYQNLIANGSFEQGSWQDQVSDCRNYDNAGKVGMNLDTAIKTDGKQSLALSAAHHDACIHTTTNVTAGSDYQLSFDYFGKAGQDYGYAVSFDDPNNTMNRQQLPISTSDSWQHATVRIHAPANASTMTLYLYAFEPSGKGVNVVHYDNVRFLQMPDFVDTFFVVTSPAKTLYTPATTSFDRRGPTQTAIHIKSASTPFVLYLSETYHPKWRLELANSNVQGPINSWLPSAAGNSASIHTTLDNYMNAWLVDPAKLCQQQAKVNAGCTKNADGSYDIELLAEFAPQRWFVVSTVLSWLTITACTIFLVASRGRDVPTYQAFASAYRQWPRFLRRRS